MDKSRHIISNFLLAVFLSALFVSSFHTHPAHFEEPLCEDCVHHLPHPGHIGSQDGALSECLLCHFLALPYVIALAVLVLAPARLLSGVIFHPQWAPVSAHLHHTRSRAPPVFFFV